MRSFNADLRSLRQHIHGPSQHVAPVSTNVANQWSAQKASFLDNRTDDNLIQQAKNVWKTASTLERMDPL
jgi:hypothetical protein